ncbi:hypothetical protein [Streptomyces sp. SID3343]|uniref:hypothetical protein n=1 Tax=Streptomyces sp. SID3343 TaxID=2690260 RepID=UPI00136C2A6A|nr:hypothetical protein [Streptomyces sp. SID3343]
MDIIDKAETRFATRSEVLRWEGAAWAFVGVTWIVSAWPGLLVPGSDPITTVLAGVGLLSVVLAWQVARSGGRARSPGRWVGRRVRPARPERRRKNRRHVLTTVVLDAAVIGGSAVLWCVLAHIYQWPESITGAGPQNAVGVACLGWAALHVPAARRVAASGEDDHVVSRRVLGAGAPTVEPKSPRRAPEPRPRPVSATSSVIAAVDANRARSGHHDVSANASDAATRTFGKPMTGVPRSRR